MQEYISKVCFLCIVDVPNFAYMNGLRLKCDIVRFYFFKALWIDLTLRIIRKFYLFKIPKNWPSYGQSSLSLGWELQKWCTIFRNNHPFSPFVAHSHYVMPCYACQTNPKSTSFCSSWPPLSHSVSHFDFCYVFFCENNIFSVFVPVLHTTFVSMLACMRCCT